MGSIGNTSTTNKPNSNFSISADSLKISDSEARQIETFVNGAAEAGYEEDGHSIITNITPAKREILESAIKQYFKTSFDWDVDVFIRRKVQGGTRSRLKDGGMKGKTYWTEISYRRIR